MSRRLVLHGIVPIAVLIAAVVAETLAGTADSTASTPQPPAPQAAPLSVLAASIEEVPPIDWRRIPAREVLIILTLSASPACDGRGAPFEVGLLIDRDRQAATGVRLPDFPQLGVDTRLAMACEPASGRLGSRLGSVTIEPQPRGNARVTLRTTVARLPSLEFLWLPYVRNGPSFVAGPFQPTYGFWRITERLHL